MYCTTSRRLFVLPQQVSQSSCHLLRVRSPSRPLHHLPDQPHQHFLLTGAHLLRLLGQVDDDTIAQSHDVFLRWSRGELGSDELLDRGSVGVADEVAEDLLSARSCSQRLAAATRFWDEQGSPVMRPSETASMMSPS